MPTVIEGEAALPEETCYYVRLKSDPRLLQHSRSGVVYARADGKNWEWPGYTRQMRRDGTWEPVEGRGAYCDSEMYPYTNARRAA